MQKKLLAVAVAGALGAPALATAQSTVQIFGTAYIEYSFYTKQGQFGGPSAVGGPINDRERVDFLQSPGSELGFKGEEKLGGGMSAWFQCASTMDIRGASPEGVCSRNSALGLKGAWGNVFIGRWDTPFKRTISPTNVAGNDTGVWGTAFLLTGGSTSTLDASSRATFKRRQANSINYDSPDFGGFQVMAAYSAINGATSFTSGVTDSKSRVMSLGAQYSAGPLYVSLGYERHNEFGGPAFPGDDKGWHVGAAYTWGPVRFGGQYTEQKFESGPGNMKYKAFHLGADWTIVGPHGLRFAWTRARDAKGNIFTAQPAVPAAGVGYTNTFLTGTYRPACVLLPAPAAVGTSSCSDTGANLYQIRYVYTFSKRTEFNFGYVRLSNDDRAAYALGGLSQPNVGQNQSAFALSMRHNF
jgi:predicted porin